ncbi:hypothetical protein [Paenibacillus yonginensis]|uniref:hypothetical protein n=1 Tax=Paenibacillus yonginensis TaxID=1462996 RepID=UPI001470D044|nr:hypothetical protein [Paenibacillus yonginensis]
MKLEEGFPEKEGFVSVRLNPPGMLAKITSESEPLSFILMPYAGLTGGWTKRRNYGRRSLLSV